LRFDGNISVVKPEFIGEIKSKLGLSRDISDGEAIAEFYNRFGTPFAWANLFHDVGKAETQEPNTDPVRPAFSFHGHEEKSSELFKNVIDSHRLIFSNDEKESILFLIENHMKAHLIGTVSENELSDRVKAKIFRSKNAEALLFLGLTDSLGNYSQIRSNEDVVKQFNKSWQELMDFKVEDTKRQKILALGKTISPEILSLLDQPENAGKRGLPLVGPIKTATLLLIMNGSINENQIGPNVHEIHSLLKEKGITEMENTREMLEQARKLLEHAYGINFEDLP